MSAEAFPIGEASWAVSVNLDTMPTTETSSLVHKSSPVALHFVVDNSLSMGSLTREVIDTFADAIDVAASKPCSLTTFSNSAKLLSSSIRSSEEMKNLTLDSQGSTNIPSGVQKALGIILKRAANPLNVDTHHVLVLLTDGRHNRGGTPEKVFPTLRRQVSDHPGVKISVAVVGFSRNSSTMMAMLLKTSIETVPIDPEIVKTIYFATTKDTLRRCMKELSIGLRDVSLGDSHLVVHDENCLVEDVDKPCVGELRIHTRPGHHVLNFLCQGSNPPSALLVDGETVDVHVTNDIETTVLENITHTLLNRAKIRTVSTNNHESVRAAVKRLDELVSAIEENVHKGDKGEGLVLSKQSPSGRLRQFKTMKETSRVVRELRNQLLDLVNFKETDSEAQAHFLTGSTTKFAAKARRRAATRSTGDGILDARSELESIVRELSSADFGRRIKDLSEMDALMNLARIERKMGRQQLMMKFRQIKSGEVSFLGDMLSSRLGVVLDESVGSIKYRLRGLKSKLKASTIAYLESGRLADALNEVFHGSRQSYLSLSSSAQHMAEWAEFEGRDETDFSSLWEALLFCGAVGFPMSLEHPEAAQMNPFRAMVRWIRPSLVDTASLCCAHQSNTKLYGPEGGEPLEDVLVLVDPSCPLSSNAIYRNRLVGEKYTSAVISRDLHMYTGVSMKIALHANALFHIIAGGCQESDAWKVARDEVIADYERTTRDEEAYQCPSCEFGPILHGGCADLFSHHGERSGRHGRVSNACPQCGFFTEHLSGWDPWSGKISESLINDAVREKCRAVMGRSDHSSRTAIDMTLRILYSIRKFAGPDTRELYAEFAKRMWEWDFRLTTKDDIDGLTQVLIAMLAWDDTTDDDDNDGKIRLAFRPPMFKAFVTEACARKSRGWYQSLSRGDGAMARREAERFVTDVLGVHECTAPFTAASLMDPEPKLEDVKRKASTDFVVNRDMADPARRSMAACASSWCAALGFAKCFHEVLAARGGGWDRLETDMETGEEFYSDFVEELRYVLMDTDHSFGTMCEISEPDMPPTLLALSCRSALEGVGALCSDLDDDERPRSVLSTLARDMRIQIYLGRVREKMARWHSVGESLVFQRAVVSDLSQFIDIIGPNHVHSLSKETFWGAWRSAVSTQDRDKLNAFLASANDAFRLKYSNADGTSVLRGGGVR